MKDFNDPSYLCLRCTTGWSGALGLAFYVCQKLAPNTNKTGYDWLWCENRYPINFRLWRPQLITNPDYWYWLHLGHSLWDARKLTVALELSGPQWRLSPMLFFPRASCWGGCKRNVNVCFGPPKDRHPARGQMHRRPSRQKQRQCPGKWQNEARIQEPRKGEAGHLGRLRLRTLSQRRWGLGGSQQDGQEVSRPYCLTLLLNCYPHSSYLPARLHSLRGEWPFPP